MRSYVKQWKNSKYYNVSVIILFLLLLGLFYIILKPKSYKKEYNVNNYKVIEEYDKDLSNYYLTVKNDDIEVITVIETNYNISHKNIKDIKEINDIETNEKCLLLKSDKLLVYPLCLKDNEQIVHHSVSEKLKEEIGDKFFPEISFDNISNDKVAVNSLLNHQYYIYNYRGFYRINANGIMNINLFSKDVYDASLITKVNNYLVVPDYEEDYFFKKVYIINMINGEVKEWKLKENIYFDSVILGVMDNSLYLVDKHENREWELNVKKRKMKKISTNNEGKIYNNGFKDVSLTKIINDNMVFEGLTSVTYKLNDGVKLVIKDKEIKVADEAKKIVAGNSKEVFYLVNDTLYSYSNYYGTVLLMKSFEWNFNYDNVIFVY